MQAMDAARGSALPSAYPALPALRQCHAGMGVAVEAAEERRGSGSDGAAGTRVNLRLRSRGESHTLHRVLTQRS